MVICTPGHRLIPVDLLINWSFLFTRVNKVVIIIILLYQLLYNCPIKNTYTYCLGLNALKCYTCQAQSSNCESDSKTCQAGLDRCAKFTFEGNGKDAVLKLCTSASSCANATAFCDNLKKTTPNLDDCKGTCCSGDNCNLSSKNSQVMFGIILFGLLAAIMLK